MIDTAERYSPGWWLAELVAKMPDRAVRFDALADYANGDAPLPEAAEGFREAYKSFQRKSRTNFAEIIVEAVQERMTVTGFRVGDDRTLDEAASRIWSVNEMDAQASDVHGDMLGLGEGFVIVGPPEVSSKLDWLPWRKAERIPVITWEDPRTVVCEHDPLMPSRVVAALKIVTDATAGKEYAYLYLPGVVHVAMRNHVSASVQDFEWESETRLPVGVVPVVHFRNRHNLGEFETHTDLLDRINYMVLQRVVITAMQAFRQRAIIGDLPDTDEEGNPIPYAEIFRPGAGALWRISDPEVKLWESQQTDIQPMLSATKDDIRDLAAVTRTPMSMLLPDSQNQSAEGASFAREGLVYKATDRIKRAAYGWNQVMQLALLFSGNGLVRDIETLWLPADRQSLAERADAASKAQLPFGTKLRKIWQFSETEAERIEQERVSDVLMETVATAGTETGEPDVRG